MNTSIFSILFASVFLMAISQTATAQTNTTSITSLDDQIKEDIFDAFDDAIDGQYGNIDMVNISKKNDNSSIVILNITNYPEIPPTCGPNQTLTNGTCIQNPTEPPIETDCPENEVWNATSESCECREGNSQNETEACVPDGEVPPVDNQTTSAGNTTIAAAGDFYSTAGNQVMNGMKAANADYNIALGDMGYQKTLTTFAQSWNLMPEVKKCTIGNHDAENKAIYAEAIKLCGQLWFEKVANGNTLLIGFDTDGNLQTLGNNAVSKVSNDSYMQGVKNVVLFSHKQCYTHPDAHHDPEQDVEDFCNAVASAVEDTGVQMYYIAAHDHEKASTADGTKFISGGGGREERECGVDEEWTFCDNEQTGYLLLTIDHETAAIDGTFYNVKGEVIN